MFRFVSATEIGITAEGEASPINSHSLIEAKAKLAKTI